MKNERGATAVEFALVSIPFFALLLFTLQTMILFFAGQALETYNQTISRNILTGSTQKQNLNAAQFKALVCASLPSLFQCSNIYVDVQTVASFGAAPVQAPTLTFGASGTVTNTWNYSPGNAGDIVVVRMMYLWPVTSVVLNNALANEPNNSRLLLSTAVFKNEPFQ